MAPLDWLTARPIAHRGYHDASLGTVENTLPAAAEAVARSFAIECDLQLSSDGAVVVFHDETLDRLTWETGALRHHDLSELKAARFKIGTAGMATLEELLDLVDGRVPLFAELKGDWSGDAQLEAAVADILTTYAGPIAVMSFDPSSMAAMRRLAPVLPRGLITDGFPHDQWPNLSAASRLANRMLLSAALVLPRFIACSLTTRSATAPLTLRHLFGLPILTWTVRTDMERALARQSADQIIFEGFDPDA